MRNIRGQFLVLGLIDTWGNEWVGVVDGEDDIVEIYGLFDATDQPLHFKDRAHRLGELAGEYDLAYGRERKWIDISIE